MTHSKITKSEIIILEIFLTHSLFVGNGFARIFEVSGSDTWISMLLGMLLGIVILYIFDLVFKNVRYNLKLYLTQHKALKFFLYPIIFIYFFILMAFPVLAVETLVNSYYLTNTSPFLIVIPFVILLFYMSIKGKITIVRVFEFFMPFAILFTLIGILGLTKNLNFDNFLPILNNSTQNIFMGSLTFAILTGAFNFLLIDENVDFKTKLIGYILGCLDIILTSLVITGVLGKYFIKMYSFPEYMAIKKINLFSSLQNLENIIYMPGYFYLLSLASLALFKIKEMQKKESSFILPLLVSILCICLITILYSNNYSLIISTSKYLTYVLGILMFILGPVLYLLTKQRKKKN